MFIFSHLHKLVLSPRHHTALVTIRQTAGEVALPARAVEPPPPARHLVQIQFRNGKQIDIPDPVRRVRTRFVANILDDAPLFGETELPQRYSGRKRNERLGGVSTRGNGSRSPLQGLIVGDLSER